MDTVLWVLFYTVNEIKGLGKQREPKKKNKKGICCLLKYKSKTQAVRMQNSDLSQSKILKANMLQGSVNFTDFKNVRCLEIDTTLKFNTTIVLKYFNTRNKSVILCESETQNLMQNLKCFSEKNPKHSQAVAKDQQQQQSKTSNLSSLDPTNQ